MLIASPAAVYFRPSGSPPATDASGEADYGHIDTFEVEPNEGPRLWRLDGAWGEALVTDPVIALVFDH
jgi:hypothetical protein